jgi:hypothetical protein
MLNMHFQEFARAQRRKLSCETIPARAGHREFGTTPQFPGPPVRFRVRPDGDHAVLAGVGMPSSSMDDAEICRAVGSQPTCKRLIRGVNQLLGRDRMADEELSGRFRPAVLNRPMPAFRSIACRLVPQSVHALTWLPLPRAVALVAPIYRA